MKRVLFLSALLVIVAFTAAAKKPALGRGLDSLVFTQYEPLSDRPIKVFTYIPVKGDIKAMPVLITFHGAERSGMNGIICWREFAEKDGFIVISPEFSRAAYPENDYQFGGVIDPVTGEVRPEEKWTYSIVEPLFDYIKGIIGNKSNRYNIQGHSAGGQFTHRYLIAKPAARVDRAVACNPGSWTWCDPSGLIMGSERTFTWPYSIAETPFNDREHLEAFFARDFHICLGERDCDPNGKGAPTDAASLQEGRHRLERGKNFFAAMKEIAEQEGLPFRWDISVVEGIGHQGRGMVYGKKNAQGKYSADSFSTTAAWYLIFGNR